MHSNRTGWMQQLHTMGTPVLVSAAFALVAGCNEAGPGRTAELTALETRVSALEARLEQLGSGAAASDMGAPSGSGAAAAPASAGSGPAMTQGYEGVYVKLHVDGTEAKLSVNGRVIGAYSSATNLYLDSMLTPGAMNTIGASFSAAQEGNAIEIEVRSRGGDTWNTVFNFKPQADKLESSFEVPFLGKAE